LAWDEFFYAEHHNPHTKKAHPRALMAFLGWAEGQGVERVRKVGKPWHNPLYATAF
jgi:hypothetical protein